MAIASALIDLDRQLDVLRADITFVRLAVQLRPRLGSVVQWQATGEETELAKRFMNASSNNPEGVYGALLVRLLACFERYVRNTITEVVLKKSRAASYDEVESTIGYRNLVLTGRLLSSLDTPRDHLVVDVDELIENLATCRRGSSAFRLNPVAFSSTLISVTPSTLEKAFDNVNIKDWWDKIGASKSVAGLLGTKGARATGEQAKERLKELARWRNHLAHGGEGELTISDSDLSGAVDFVGIFGAALDAVVQQH